MADSINLKFPMRRSKSGAFETNKSTIEAVTDDLRILILTNHGERPIHFDFGANLRRIIFEQGAAVAQQIEDAIIAAVEKWMPFVVLNNVEVRDSTNDPTLLPNEVRIRIDFSVDQLTGVLTQRVTI